MDILVPLFLDEYRIALPGFGATPYGTIGSFDMSAIASDCIFAKKSVAKKHGFDTGESTWIERWMVRRFLEEVRLGRYVEH
jgi:hypothetical protein